MYRNGGARTQREQEAVGLWEKIDTDVRIRAEELRDNPCLYPRQW